MLKKWQSSEPRRKNLAVEVSEAYYGDEMSLPKIVGLNKAKTDDGGRASLARDSLVGMRGRHGPSICGTAGKNSSIKRSATFSHSQAIGPIVLATR